VYCIQWPHGHMRVKPLFCSF